jgi:FtsP/CotA-like multicopper oxidase with cupredoxin domain
MRTLSRFLDASPLLGLFAAASLAAGCLGADQTEPVETSARASVTTPQTPLSGNTVAKFVDPLPTFNGRRSDGTTTQQITMQEFQQKVLPNAFYNTLSGVNRNGTFLWGYNINGAGASFPARTIESRRGAATTAIYTNSLSNTHLQSLLTVDQTIHWADPLGTTARNNCVNGPPLAAACTQPFSGPIPAVVHLHGDEVLSQYDGHPDAWWTPVLRHHLQLQQPAGGDDALVPRPLARDRAPQRLRGSRRLLPAP